MGMDGIGGVGALNVSSQTRVTRPQSETVDVNTGSTANQQVQAATLPPVLEKAVAAIIIASRVSRIEVRYRPIRKLHRTRSRQRSMI